MKKYLLLLPIFIFNLGFGQQPRYTVKKFVSNLDTNKFKITNPNQDGFLRTYIETETIIWDTDDDETTYLKGNIKVLLCFEGQKVKGKRNGIFQIFLIDSLDHSKRYKIGEQTFYEDKLNGVWKVYTLKGKLVHFETFKNDSIFGITRNYWVDGKTIINETDYINGKNKYIEREFGDNGKVKVEMPFENGELNGIGKKFYENGIVQEITEFKNGMFNGNRKYFYPNGQIWIEEIYKNGRHWTVLGNYSKNGKPRNAGSLKNGEGTLILYNEDDTIRQTLRFVNGLEVK